jgi:hypothetical protein
MTTVCLPYVLFGNVTESHRVPSGSSSQVVVAIAKVAGIEDGSVAYAMTRMTDDRIAPFSFAANRALWVSSKPELLIVADLSPTSTVEPRSGGAGK